MSPSNDQRILILAPTGRDADLTASALSKVDLEAVPCPSVEDLCICVNAGAAVAIVAEEALTENAVQCISDVLDRQPEWSDLPFVILTTGGRSNEFTLSHVRLIERLGHITLLERPLRIVTLVTAVRAGIRSRKRQYELRDRVEALHASERRFRSAFEHAAVGMSMQAPDGHFLEVNAALADITGYTVQELLEKSVADITHPEDWTSSQERHAQILAGELDYTTHETRYIRKTGEVVWVRVSASAVPDEHNNPVNTISLIEEITYRRQAEEALTRQAEELARSNADLQQFAWVTSHDLREPIRTLISFSQLLLTRHKGKLDQEAERAPDFIESSSRRMESLVRDLLSYSRVVNADERAFSRVSLNGSLDWALSNLQLSLQDSKAKIVRSELPDVFGDEVQIVQLLQNLLSNAIKYRGEAPLQIQISGRAENGQCIVSVKDNGMGIDPRYHERVFGLFKRLHGAEIQGTGLGLAICRKIVERHGGSIWVESALGQGASFFFTLPLAEGQTRG